MDNGSRWLLTCPNCVPLKLYDLREVLNHKLDAVSSRVDVELVRDAARVQQAIQLLRTLLESIIVIVAHVEVDFHLLEGGYAIRAGEMKDVVAVEVGPIERRTEDAAEHSSRRAGAIATDVLWQVSNQGRHLRADCGKVVGILEGEAQRSISAHRNAGNAACRSRAGGAVLFFHLRHKLLDEEVLVADLAVFRVHVEG